MVLCDWCCNVVVVVGVVMFVEMEGRSECVGVVSWFYLLFCFILWRDSLKMTLRSSCLCPCACNFLKNSLLMLWKSFGSGFCCLYVFRRLKIRLFIVCFGCAE